MAAPGRVLVVPMAAVAPAQGVGTALNPQEAVSIGSAAPWMCAMAAMLARGIRTGALVPRSGAHIVMVTPGFGGHGMLYVMGA